MTGLRKNVASQVVTFCLVNATTGFASWVSIGDTFAGYRVQSYNASPDGKSDSVTLSGNGAPLRLTLATSKVRSSNKWSTRRGGCCSSSGTRVGETTSRRGPA